MAVRAILIVSLRQVFGNGGQVELDTMIDRPAETAMVMGIEVVQVARDALSGAIQRRTFPNASIGVMAGGATAA